MDLLCMSCRRRVLLQSMRLCGLHRKLRPLSRQLHSSHWLLALNRPKLSEEGVNNGTSPLTFDQPKQVDHATSVATHTEDDRAIRERYHGNKEPEESCKGSTLEEVVEEWREQKISLSQLPSLYLRLSKYRLTALVVLTALGGYTMAPGVLDPSTILWTATGTALCSGAANCFNQWIEVPYDCQMARTRNRVLVRGLLSPLHAALFGLSTAMAGTLILWQLVNPVTAALGAANIALYTAVYTPMKRISIANTWIGSIVGAIPPVMGWTACTGGVLDSGALVLAGVLYAWQFAHFNALSWGLRGDYSRAGYRMMAVTDPALCKRVALRYSLALLPICSLAAPLCGSTSWWFAADSLPLNAWLVVLAWRFYRDSDFKSARKLFQFSLFHLPLLMGLMFLNKKEWHSQNRETTI